MDGQQSGRDMFNKPKSKIFDLRPKDKKLWYKKIQAI
jgi:hypothetical protein